MNQKLIMISAKFYEARDAVIALIGREKFIQNVDNFRPILNQMCANNKITQMEATIQIIESLAGKGTEMILAMAACTEIMEPSLATNETE